MHNREGVMLISDIRDAFAETEKQPMKKRFQLDDEASACGPYFDIESDFCCKPMERPNGAFRFLTKTHGSRQVDGRSPEMTFDDPDASCFSRLTSAMEALDGMSETLGRVLVMDDEPMVREVTGDILREFGYEVHCAVDGDEAVRRCREACENGRPFDVVILDLEVPTGMGGREAVSMLKAIDPAVSAIVTSGDGRNPVMVDYPRHGFDAVLVKPSDIMTLKRTLAKAIADKS